MLIALLLAVATPDPSLARLAGSWSCTTAAASDVLIEAQVSDAGNLTMKARWRNYDPDSLRAPVRGAWTQTIAAPVGGEYAVENVSPAGWDFTGISPGFSGDTMEVKGTQKTAHQQWNEAERYTMKNGDREFTHEWFALSGDQWKLTSRADCRKV